MLSGMHDTQMGAESDWKYVMKSENPEPSQLLRAPAQSGGLDDEGARPAGSFPKAIRSYRGMRHEGDASGAVPRMDETN